MPADLSASHINQALASVAINPVNPEISYAWQRAAYIVPVTKKSNVYFVYGRELGAAKSPTGSNARAIRSLRVGGAKAAELDYTLSTQTYLCSEYALSDFVPDEEIRDADSPLDPLMDAGLNVSAQVDNDIENLWVKIALDYTQYNASNKVTLTTGGTGTSWLSYTSANSDPLGQIRTARKRIEQIIQRPPNTMVLAAEAARVLAEHPQIKDIAKYTVNGFELLASDSGLPPELRGLKIVVASAVANTAAEGAAYSGDYIAKDSNGNDFALICYVPRQAGLGKRAVTSFIGMDCPDATTGKRGRSLRSWRDEARKGWMVEAAQTIDFRFPFQDGSNLNTGAYLMSGVTL